MALRPHGALPARGRYPAIVTSHRVLVTGAAGNVGAATVDALLAAGIAVTAGDLDPDRIRDRFPDATPVRLDFTDDRTFASALEGCDGLFLLRPPPISRVGPTLNRLVDVAARSRVRHVVFSSVAGADTNRIVPHHRVKTHLRARGLPWTILRPGFFAQNLSGAYRTDIVEDDRLFVPAGDGRVAFVDVADLGHVAALVFSEPHRHVGEGYHLTGPEAITFDRVAELLSDALERRIRYEAATVPAYVAHLRRRRLPMVQIAVETVLHVGLRRGDAEAIDPTLEQLLGRPATALPQFIADHAAIWRR